MSDVIRLDPHRKRSSYTRAQKDEAVEVYRIHGATEASRRTGIPTSTLSSWAVQRGVRTIRNERTAAAVEAIQLDAAERKGRLADRLLEIAELATDQVVAKLSEASVRDLVGAWTRAIHDARLLDGEATSRVEHRTFDQLDAEIDALLTEEAGSDGTGSR